jgi:hypothetical protein
MAISHEYGYEEIWRDASSPYYRYDSTADADADAYERWLSGVGAAAAYGGSAKQTHEPVDYSVLCVGVMTLGLILCVEVIRHRLDHEAAHRPFFKVVLEVTYSECEYRSKIPRRIQETKDLCIW